MASFGLTRVLIVLASTLVAGALIAGDGAATRQKGPPLQPNVAQAFPRTYHIWGNDRDLGRLARYDMVVGYAYWRIRALRQRNPTGIFLLAPGLNPKDPQDYRGVGVTYGAVHRWEGGSDRVPGGRALGPIRAFDPQWDQLYNADGSLSQVNNVWRHRGWNLADPGRMGTPELVAKVVAHAAKLGGLYARGWDGVHSDNWIYRIGVAWFYGPNLDADRDGRVDDYDALRRNWSTGLTRVGRLLRTYLPRKVVGGNGNWNVGSSSELDFRRYLSTPDDHLNSANYTLLEGLELYAARADEVIGAAREWLGYRDPRRQRRYFAILHKLAGEGDYRSMRWGLSLATIAGAHYGSYAASHGDLFWYDEYDGGDGVRRRHWLGKPVLKPYKLPTGVWRRDFRNGIVLNNSTSAPQSVRLGAVFWRLRGTQDGAVNTGARVTTVTIPAQDGIFLLRRPDGSTPRNAAG